MGFFKKLFGSGKNRNFAASKELMPEEQFWQIIETSFTKAAGNFEEQQDILKDELRNLSPQDLIHFDNQFRNLRGNAYDWRLWGAIYIIHGGCSDDSFMDFRDWLIAQGKAFYYKTIQDPETLIDVELDKIEIDWEGMSYIPTEVFEEMTGQDLPAGFEENHNIKGQEWSEDTDDLKNMFPKLWAKYA